MGGNSESPHSSLLRKVRRDTTVCRSPYHHWWGVDRASHVPKALEGNIPLTCDLIAPMRMFVHLTYIECREVHLPWVKLEPKRHWVSFSRCDLEKAAECLPAAQRCQY